MIDNRVIITQYCTEDRWLIKLDIGRLIPRRNDVPDWSTCPGSLYQDFETSDDAVTVAKWWGFEPTVRTHQEMHNHGVVRNNG